MSHRFFASVSFISLLVSLLVSAASSANTQSSLKVRLDSANRVVVGKVVLVKAEPAAGLPISEHSPDWRDIVIEIKETLKGKPRLALLVVRFPQSMDVAWYDAPKFSLGQKGIWILHKDESGLYTALNPLDFQPKEETDSIRRALVQ